MKKTPIESEDEQLILACRRGDNAAWEKLVARYQRLVYSIPRRAGLDDDTCADVFQRTFLLLFQHLDRIEQPERLSAWLVTTAKRETIRIHQRMNQVQVLELDDGAGGEESGQPLLDATPLPDEIMLQIEEQHLVRRVLGEMEDRCRNLLTLLFYTEEPPAYTAIAEAVGIPAGSIGPTRARCLQKLARLLQDVGFVMYFLLHLALCMDEGAVIV
jgi:RNA polymerase sigma factor (sigma-70 family)